MRTQSTKGSLADVYQPQMFSVPVRDGPSEKVETVVNVAWDLLVEDIKYAAEHVRSEVRKRGGHFAMALVVILLVVLDTLFSRY